MFSERFGGFPQRLFLKLNTYDKRPFTKGKGAYQMEADPMRFTDSIHKKINHVKC